MEIDERLDHLHHHILNHGHAGCCSVCCSYFLSRSMLQCIAMCCSACYGHIAFCFTVSLRRAVCCSVAVSCSVLQSAAVRVVDILHCVLQRVCIARYVAVFCMVAVAVCCSVLQGIAGCWSVRQFVEGIDQHLEHLHHLSLQITLQHPVCPCHTATRCNTLQHTAALSMPTTQYNTLQYCNTLQHTARCKVTATHIAALSMPTTQCNTGCPKSLQTHCSTATHIAAPSMPTTQCNTGCPESLQTHCSTALK